MTIKSNKQKGRRLQQWVVSKLLLLLPGVKTDDVVSRPMGSNGDDIMLSPYARKLFPYSIECKNQESGNVWKAYEQAGANSGNYTPIVVMKKNNHKPLVVIDAVEFVNIMENVNAEKDI